MSQTLGVTDANVRVKLGDTDAASYAISPERLRDIIRGVARRWAMWFGVEEDWDLSIFIFSAADDEASGNTEYNKVRAVKNDATGQLLERVTAEQMARLYDGSTASNPPTGAAIAYTLTEVDGTPILRIYPAAPSNNYTFSALVSQPVPETLTDATSYALSKHMMTGIEAQSAAEAASVMRPADRERLGITPELVGLWRAVANETMAGERTRLGRMRDASHIPAQVN